MNGGWFTKTFRIPIRSMALRLNVEAVRNAIDLHCTGQRRLARIDGQSRHKPNVPFVAKYKQLASEAEVSIAAAIGGQRFSHWKWCC